jgi:hypothetical protein
MWEYLVELFARAAKNKALTAHERAALKALQGALLGILIDAGPQLASIGTGQAHFNLTGMTISALLGAVALGTLKLWLSQSDPQVGLLLDAYAKQKEQNALSGLFAPGPDGAASTPAMHFVLSAPSIAVSQNVLPVVTSTSSSSTRLAMKDVAAAFASAPPVVSDPHSDPTESQPIVDKALLNTAQVPAVSLPPTPSSSQFQPLAFTQSVPQSALPGTIPLPPLTND